MILCAGEALIDMLPRKTTEGEAAFAPYAGGSVLNTAVALGRLGAPVGFFSGVSTDMFGQVLVDHLEASNVDTSALARSARPTTMAYVTLVDGNAQYAFYDEGTAGRMLSEADLPEVTADALFFGGISLPVEPCGATYEALAVREARTRVIMVDPNIRPSFITDEARYRARLEALFAVADIVKTSDEDLEWITGGTDPTPLLAKGVKVVLLTKGSDGIDVHTPSLMFSVPAVQADVVDTVGAGDTFSAGVLKGLHDAGALTKAALLKPEEAVLRAAVELGAKAAAITVSRAGANPPWANEL